MEFEFDLKKSLVNKEKHGVDFDAAKLLWAGEAVVIPARIDGETRSMIIGWIGERLYSCIFTIRRGRVRIISCRRSRDKERGFYHEKTRDR